MRIVHLFALVSMIVSTCLADSTPTPRNRVLIHRDRGHVVAIVWMRDDKIEKVAGKLPEASSSNVTEKACDEKTYRSSLTQLAIWEANPNRPALDVLASPTEKFELRGKFPTAERSIPAEVEEQKQVHIFSRNPLEEFAIRNQADEERSLLTLTVDRPQAPREHHQHDLHRHELNRSDRDELDRLNSQMLSRRETLRSNFAFDEFESAQRFRAKSDQAHRETVEGVREKAEQTEREAKQVALALLPVIASQGLSASTSAASGVSSGVGAKTVHAVKSKMPASSPMDHGSPEASSKSQAGAFQMSPGAKRAADYLAALPQRQPPPNATHVTGMPVNADRLPLPWPEPIDCGRYWNESHPSCSVYSDPWGFDALLPVGRGTSLFRSRATTPFWRARSTHSKGGSFIDKMSPSEAARYEKYWQRYAPDQISPGNRRLDFERFSSRAGQTESSRVVYDEFGRQTHRIDFTDHMRPFEHSSPHLHQRQHGPGFSPYRESLHNLFTR